MLSLVGTNKNLIFALFYFFRLIGGLLQTIRKQYFVLKGHGLVTSEVSEDFIGLKQLIDGAQEVRWADQNFSPQKRSPLLSFPVLSTSTHASPGIILCVPYIAHFVTPSSSDEVCKY